MAEKALKSKKVATRTVKVKSVDQMIEDNPAHSNSATREYLRQLMKGKVHEDWQKGGR